MAFFLLRLIRGIDGAAQSTKGNAQEFEVEVCSTDGGGRAALGSGLGSGTGTTS